MNKELATNTTLSHYGLVYFSQVDSQIHLFDLSARSSRRLTDEQNISFVPKTEHHQLLISASVMVQSLATSRPLKPKGAFEKLERSFFSSHDTLIRLPIELVPCLKYAQQLRFAKITPSIWKTYCQHHSLEM